MLFAARKQRIFRQKLSVIVIRSITHDKTPGEYSRFTYEEHFPDEYGLRLTAEIPDREPQTHCALARVFPDN
jgi:hypothetical protein